MLRATLVGLSGAAAGAAVGLRSPRGSYEIEAGASTKSIYDSPSSEVVLAPTSLPLQGDFANLRRALYGAEIKTSASAREVIHEWIGAEQRIGSKLSSLIPRDEPLSPGIYSVGIATLLGSIVSRNRGVVLRLLTPSVFFIIASKLALPSTTANFTTYLDSLHQEYSPKTASVMHDISGVVSRGWRRASAAEADARHVLKGVISSTTVRMKQASERNVEDHTNESGTQRR